MPDIKTKVKCPECGKTMEVEFDPGAKVDIRCTCGHMIPPPHPKKKVK